MELKLTQREVKDLANPKHARNAYPKAGSTIIWDSRLAGFGLRLTSGGTAAFIMNYRTKQGKQRRDTIGRWPTWTADAAYKEAEEIRKAVDRGGDPLESKKAQAVINEHTGRTLASVAKDYLQNYAPFHKRPTSVRDDTSMLQTIVLPRLGKMPLSDIRTEHIEKLHHDLKGTPIRANRVLALLSKIYNRIIAEDEEKAQHYTGADPVRWITLNPTKRVARYPEQKRTRWLTKAELDALRRGLDRYSSQDAADAIRLLILTGSRENEVLSAKWEEFDLARGFWTKPSHHTKQKKTETLELGAATLALLQKMAKKKKGSGTYLFPGRATASRGSHRGHMKWAWAAICKEAGLAQEIRVGGKRGKELSRWKPTVRLHDLRHSFASHLVSSGTSLPTIGNVLGHTQAATTSRYSHLAGSAQRDAMDRFSKLIGW